MRPLRIQIVVIALLAATLLAQSGLRAQEKTGTVRGFVRDASTGVPLPQVQVAMTGEVTVAAITTTAGSFMIEGVPVGLYALSYASANHQAVNIEALEVVAGETADASTEMSKKGESTVAPSQATRQPKLAEHEPASTDSSTVSAEEIRDETSSDASEAGKQVEGATTTDDFVFVRAVSRRSDRTVTVGRKGVQIRSPDGAFTSEMHLRSQIRFSSPIASAPRKPDHFLQPNGRDLRFRRARFKSSGQVFRPWIQYATEYDLVGTRLLDARVTVQKWEWLQFRFGQWKTEFGRERVSSSGRQEFVERSIVNRQFTADRQKGFMVLGRVNKGTWADSRYYAGVFSGNGRGFRSSGAGSLGQSRWCSDVDCTIPMEFPEG